MAVVGGPLKSVRSNQPLWKGSGSDMGTVALDMNGEKCVVESASYEE